MLDELIPLLEGVFVQQQADPLTRCELALQMLLLDAVLAAAEFRRLAGGFQPFDDIPLHRRLILLVF